MADEGEETLGGGAVFGFLDFGILGEAVGDFPVKEAGRPGFAVEIEEFGFGEMKFADGEGYFAGPVDGLGVGGVGSAGAPASESGAGVAAFLSMSTP